MAPRTTATKTRRLNSTSVHAPPLPIDLVLEILYRLPVKSLIQFKSVCKSWKSLISDHKFAKNHRHVFTRHHLLFPNLTKDDYTFKTCPLSILFTRKITPTATATQELDYPLSNRIGLNFDQIHGSCHGILCITLHRSFVILWNPSIKEFTILPSLEVPAESNTVYSGFGYDHSNDTYKVIAFCCTKLDNEVYQVRTHMHIMGTNFWRRIQDFPYANNWGSGQSGKFVCGTLNWLTLSSQVIVSLDLEKESYRELSLPDYGDLGVKATSLCVLRDCLCILSSHIGCCSEIWLMKEYGNRDSWTKLFYVPHMRGGGGGIYTRVLYVYEDHQVLLEFLMKLVVYNSRDGTFKTLKVQKRHGWMFPDVYQESLISPCCSQ